MAPFVVFLLGIGVGAPLGVTGAFGAAEEGLEEEGVVAVLAAVDAGFGGGDMEWMGCCSCAWAAADGA